MNTNLGKEMLTTRDIQEIKLTLRMFSENSIDQLKLLREALSQVVSSEADINKKTTDISFILKDFKKNIEENDKNIKSVKEVLTKIENKTVDRNNKDAIIMSIEKVKKTADDVEDLVKAMNVFLSENKLGIREIEDKLDSMEASLVKILKEVSKAHDVKKNLSWWVDWIYKVLLTIGVIYGLLSR